MSGLIPQIYESIGNAEALARTIAQVARLTGSQGAQFGVLDGAGRWIQATIVGFDPVDLGTYVAFYMADDPRLAHWVRHPGELITGESVIPDLAVFKRSALVNEFLDKHEARFSMGSVIPAGGTHSRPFP